MSEETKNAEKIIPKALIYAIGITSVMYILVAVSIVSVVPWQELAESASPLALVAEKILGNSGALTLSVIALFSTANTALLILLAASRIVFGIGEDKDFPHIIAKIHPKTQTPYIAIILVMITTIAFALIEDIGFVAGATDFLLFAIFIIINAAVIALRLKQPKTKRPFRIPFSIKNIPVTAVLGILTSIALMVHIELEVMALALGLIGLGLLFYFLSQRIHAQTTIKNV